MLHNFNTQLGKAGETLVMQQLAAQGFTILATNYRWRGGEIDVIAQKNELVVMVEVKTRTKEYVTVAEMVPVSKQDKIIKTARHFLTTHRLHDVVIRFDVAHVIDKTVSYIPNAFEPRGDYGY
jgi:putative endonuclease